MGTIDRMKIAFAALTIAFCVAAHAGEQCPPSGRDLQAEIDEIAKAGGGTLRLKAGTYKTGALFFKPGVNLHLEKGATSDARDAHRR